MKPPFRPFKLKETAAAALLLAALLCSCTGRGRYVAVTGYAQGGTYSVKFNTVGVRVPREDIAAAIDSILTLVDTTLSGYNKASLLSRFNAGEVIVPNQLFSDIYGYSYDIWKETGGCVNVAAGPLFDIWGFGFTTDSLPSGDIVLKAMSESDMGRLRDRITPGEPIDAAGLLSGDITSGQRLATLDPSHLRWAPPSYDAEGGTVAGSDIPGQEGLAPVKLNFNAIAQGYTCDLVADYLKSIGVTDMLVDIGEIYCAGRNPSGRDWSIGVDRPVDGNDTPGADLDGIWLSQGRSCGIVTSGNYRKFYVRNGRKYAHTVDPRTGYPVDHSLLSATVVAPSAAEADALATYCMVLGFDEARTFIESRSDLEGYLIRDVDGTMSEWASPGFTLRSAR